ncbi:MAG: hypothetical protein M0D57_04125 [Sphingobacteriales bacterium JAD_PAG50586_3]|nr:MAG: hypothetical protein M0D57_04125 [Sphingobacteriales bacterium JAD_PAG50586_3]
MAEAKKELKVFARPYLKESLPFDEVIEYRNGKIIIGGGVEMAGYHFVTEKNIPKTSFLNGVKSPTIIIFLQRVYIPLTK